MLLMELGMARKSFVMLGGMVKNADATLELYSPQTWKKLLFTDGELYLCQARA